MLLTAAVTTPAWMAERDIVGRWEDSAIKLSTSPEPAARIGAFRVLAPLSDSSQRARQVVSAAMQDESPMIRSGAAAAAGAAGAHARPLLTDLHLLQRDDPNDAVRNAATSAVMAIESSPQPRGNQWPAVIALVMAVIAAALWYFRIKPAAPAGEAAKTV
jgi:hypothetical protein